MVQIPWLCKYCSKCKITDHFYWWAEKTLHYFAYNWFPWGPAQSLISDKVQTSGGVINYNAIMTEPGNEISQEAIRALWLRVVRKQSPEISPLKRRAHSWDWIQSSVKHLDFGFWYPGISIRLLTVRLWRIDLSLRLIYIIYKMEGVIHFIELF